MNIENAPTGRPVSDFLSGFFKALETPSVFGPMIWTVTYEQRKSGAETFKREKFRLRPYLIGLSEKLIAERMPEAFGSGFSLGAAATLLVSFSIMPVEERRQWKNKIGKASKAAEGLNTSLRALNPEQKIKVSDDHGVSISAIIAAAYGGDPTVARSVNPLSKLQDIELWLKAITPSERFLTGYTVAKRERSKGSWREKDFARGMRPIMQHLFDDDCEAAVAAITHFCFQTGTSSKDVRNWFAGKVA